MYNFSLKQKHHAIAYCIVFASLERKLMTHEKRIMNRCDCDKQCYL